MADLRSKLHNVRQEGIFEMEAFEYDAAQDAFKCPAGEKLTRHHFHHQRGYYEYRTAPGICSGCVLAPQCTRAKYGRTLNRYPEQALLDKARKQSHGAAAKRDRKRRQWLQERNFGEAAVEHGFKRARWRGLGRQQIQDWLIAAIQNLKIYLRRREGGKCGGKWRNFSTAERVGALGAGVIRLFARYRSSFRLTPSLSACI
jgi:hypothetical protein